MPAIMENINNKQRNYNRRPHRGSKRSLEPCRHKRINKKKCEQIQDNLPEKFVEIKPEKFVEIKPEKSVEMEPEKSVEINKLLDDFDILNLSDFKYESINLENGLNIFSHDNHINHSQINLPNYSEDINQDELYKKSYLRKLDNILIYNLLSRKPIGLWTDYLSWFRELYFILDFIDNNFFSICYFNNNELANYIYENTLFLKQINLDLILVQNIKRIYSYPIIQSGAECNLAYNILPIALHKNLCKWQIGHTVDDIQLFQSMLRNELNYIIQLDKYLYVNNKHLYNESHHIVYEW
jgi:hypothetical protein